MAPHLHADINGAAESLRTADTTPTKVQNLQQAPHCAMPADGMHGCSSQSDYAPNRWRQLRQMLHTLTGLDNPGAKCRKRSLPQGSHRMLLLHHDFWLEALDAKHRYGFHLRAFHKVWKHEMAAMQDDDAIDSRNRSFFYWLDCGHGAQLTLPECNRMELDETCVQYCSPQQRCEFEVEFSEARLQFVATQTAVHTDNLSKWIFVLSQDDKLYVARKQKGRFHHSSFLAGVPIVAAGKIFVEKGVIQAVEPHSGHFKPRLTSLLALCRIFHSRGVDLSSVHFIKPKKWNDPWPFDENDQACEQGELVSDSEDS